MTCLIVDTKEVLHEIETADIEKICGEKVAYFHSYPFPFDDVATVIFAMDWINFGPVGMPTISAIKESDTLIRGNIIFTKYRGEISWEYSTETAALTLSSEHEGLIGEDENLAPSRYSVMVALTALSLISLHRPKLSEADAKYLRRIKSKRKIKCGDIRNKYYVLGLSDVRPQNKGCDESDRDRQRHHMRRGHLRHYKSGKVVPVQSYWAGDKSLGTVYKDYKLKEGVLRCSISSETSDLQQ